MEFLLARVGGLILWMLTLCGVFMRFRTLCVSGMLVFLGLLASKAFASECERLVPASGASGWTLVSRASAEKDWHPMTEAVSSPIAVHSISPYFGTAPPVHARLALRYVRSWMLRIVTDGPLAVRGTSGVGRDGLPVVRARLRLGGFDGYPLPDLQVVQSRRAAVPYGMAVIEVRNADDIVAVMRELDRHRSADTVTVSGVTERDVLMRLEWPVRGWELTSRMLELDCFDPAGDLQAGSS